MGRSLARMALSRVELAGIVLDQNVWRDLNMYGVEAGGAALPSITKGRRRLVGCDSSQIRARFQSVRRLRL